MHRFLAVTLSIFALCDLVASAAAQAPTQRICIGSPIPKGWVITDLMYQIGQCGANGAPVQGFANVEIITNISAMPVGATIEICAGVPYPVGWVITSGPSQNISRCHGWGAPPQFTVQWIKRIS